jgi:hypothetical protein
MVRIRGDAERYLFAVVFAWILRPVNIGESQVESPASHTKAFLKNGSVYFTQGAPSVISYCVIATIFV